MSFVLLHKQAYGQSQVLAENKGKKREMQVGQLKEIESIIL